MSNIRMVTSGFDVEPLVAQLAEHEHLWNQITMRRDHPQSPHRAIDDIWVRYKDIGLFDPAAGREGFVDGPHESVWYPAYRELPALRPLIFDLMRHVEGVRLGAVLITRIPPGAECKPHRDGGWHVENYSKFVIQLRSTPEQAFHFEGEKLVAEPGDVYWFDNRHTHWVTNDSDQARMSLIVAIQTDQGG